MKQLLLILVLVSLACFAFAQGTLVAWGPSTHQIYSNIPTGDDFIAVAAGKNFAVALRQNGTLVDWGSFNQVTGSTPTGNNFIAVAAGEEHALALRSDGTIAAWGKNNKGQSAIPPYSDFTKIAAGRYHNVALRAGGVAYAWGDNSSSQCVVPAGTFTDVAAGSAFSVGINTAGQLIPWGVAWNGELNVPSGSNFVKVGAKFLHGVALRSNGELVAWGNNALNTTVPAGVYRDFSAGWQGNVGIKTDGTLTAWANLYNLRTIPAWVAELSISSVSCGDDYNLGITGPPALVDSDADGIPDDLDEYPTDPLRAYNVQYPLDSATGWGTLAYEDMWPQKGDYDFNDLVLGYKMILVLDADLKVKDIKTDIKLRAVGATFQNAFAIEFPFSVANVESVSGLGAGVAYNMPLLEAGSHSILKVISNTNDFVNVPGHDVFWNTQLTQPSYDAVPLSFVLTLAEPFDQNLAPDWGIWNPYLMVNRVLGHEIHLPGFPPTVHANVSLFGMDDDSTDPGNNRYYKTTNNLPWALNLPINWEYPIERKQITFAYLAFAPWAESGGSTYLNWYELVSDQINADNIYNP